MNISEAIASQLSLSSRLVSSVLASAVVSTAVAAVPAVYWTWSVASPHITFGRHWGAPSLSSRMVTAVLASAVVSTAATETPKVFWNWTWFGVGMDLYLDTQTTFGRYSETPSTTASLAARAATAKNTERKQRTATVEEWRVTAELISCCYSRSTFSPA